MNETLKEIKFAAPVAAVGTVMAGFGIAHSATHDPAQMAVAAIAGVAYVGLFAKYVISTGSSEVMVINEEDKDQS